MAIYQYNTQAIYEDGCLRLSERLPLAYQTPVTVLIEELQAVPAEDATARNESYNDANTQTSKVFDLRPDEVFLESAGPQMQSVSNLIRKVAASDAPVLITGESGTEKEMIALAIHRRSARRDRSFVSANCGIVPETFLGSAVFGHDEGTVLGTSMQAQNDIEVKPGGTVFLEEVGRLSPVLQLKLLKLLREKVVERGRKDIGVDVRVIASTSEELAQAARNGRFIEDLFYRLAVVVISLPPLRDRENDVILLAEAFLKRYAAEQGKRELRFAKEAIQSLQQYAWPGNVRELENCVKRAVIMSDEVRVTPADLGLTVASGETPMNLKEAREQVEREMVTKALRKHCGKIMPAAAELGISRPTFYQLMEKLGVQKPSEAE